MKQFLILLTISGLPLYLQAAEAPQVAVPAAAPQVAAPPDSSVLAPEVAAPPDFSGGTANQFQNGVVVGKPSGAQIGFVCPAGSKITSISAYQTVNGLSAMKFTCNDETKSGFFGYPLGSLVELEKQPEILSYRVAYSSGILTGMSYNVKKVGKDPNRLINDDSCPLRGFEGTNDGKHITELVPMFSCSKDAINWVKIMVGLTTPDDYETDVNCPDGTVISQLRAHATANQVEAMEIVCSDGSSQPIVGTPSTVANVFPLPNNPSARGIFDITAYSKDPGPVLGLRVGDKLQPTAGAIHGDPVILKDEKGCPAYGMKVRAPADKPISSIGFRFRCSTLEKQAPIGAAQPLAQAEQLQPIQQFPQAQQLQPEQQFPQAQEVQPMQQFPQAQQLQPEQQFPQAQQVQPVQQFPQAQQLQQEQRFPRAQQLQPEQQFPQAQQVQPVQQFPQAQQLQPEQQFPQAQQVQTVQQFPQAQQVQPQIPRQGLEPSQLQTQQQQPIQ